MVDGIFLYYDISHCLDPFWVCCCVWGDGPMPYFQGKEGSDKVEWSQKEVICYHLTIPTFYFKLQGKLLILWLQVFICQI